VPPSEQADTNETISNKRDARKNFQVW